MVSSRNLLFNSIYLPLEVLNMQFEKPFIIELNMKTLARDNMIGTIIFTVLFLIPQFCRNESVFPSFP